MKAFLVGLLFLAAVAILIGLGTLLFPLLIVLGFFLRVALSFIFVLLSIWILGRFIIFIWEKLKS